MQVTLTISSDIFIGDDIFDRVELKIDVGDELTVTAELDELGKEVERVVLKSIVAWLPDAINASKKHLIDTSNDVTTRLNALHRLHESVRR